MSRKSLQPRRFSLWRTGGCLAVLVLCTCLPGPAPARAANAPGQLSRVETPTASAAHPGGLTDLRHSAPADRALTWPLTVAAQPVPGPATVTATVQFRVVSATDFRALAGARVALIGPDGRLLQTGLTDAEGMWRAHVTVARDPRFQDLGFVTALCVAGGHNETVVFAVPVRQGTVQPVTLNPIQPGLRNEPSAMLGQIHRLDVIDFVNRYGSALGLQRQTPIPGEQGYAPFGPRIR